MNRIVTIPVLKDRISAVRLRLLGQCSTVGSSKAISLAASVKSAWGLDRSRDNRALDAARRPYGRRATQAVTLLFVAAIGPLIIVLVLDRARADSPPKAAPAPEVRASPPESQLMHFNLLGPDWAKVPEGYSGILPEKVVAEFDIPKEYFANLKLFGFDPIEKTIEGGISITFSYPSMKGATEAPGAATRIEATITAGRSEESFRKSVHDFIFAPGRTTREPNLDVGGLCGYVDRVHPGYAGDEFYIACKETDQTFLIVCYPPFNNRHVCADNVFLGQQIVGQLGYQYHILKEHLALIGSVKQLVMSFMGPPRER